MASWCDFSVYVVQWAVGVTAFLGVLAGSNHLCGGVILVCQPTAASVASGRNEVSSYFPPRTTSIMSGRSGMAAVRQLRRVGSASSQRSGDGSAPADRIVKSKDKKSKGRKSLMERVAETRKPTGVFRARAGMNVYEQAEALAAMSSGSAALKTKEVCNIAGWHQYLVCYLCTENDFDQKECTGIKGKGTQGQAEGELAAGLALLLRRHRRFILSLCGLTSGGSKKTICKHMNRLS